MDELGAREWKVPAGAVLAAVALVVGLLVGGPIGGPSTARADELDGDRYYASMDYPAASRLEVVVTEQGTVAQLRYDGFIPCDQTVPNLAFTTETAPIVDGGFVVTGTAEVDGTTHVSTWTGTVAEDLYSLTIDVDFACGSYPDLTLQLVNVIPPDPPVTTTTELETPTSTSPSTSTIAAPLDATVQGGGAATPPAAGTRAPTPAPARSLPGRPTYAG